MPSEDKLLWWLLGGICFIAGMSALIKGELCYAVETMGLGLVFIAAGSEEFRKTLTAFFFSIFKDLWKAISYRK